MLRIPIVVIGASAGGVEAVSRVVADLPRGYPAAVFVALHFPADAVSTLPRILARAGELPARHPADHESITAGTIYVAPPDHQLLIEPGHIRLVRGPRVEGSPPVIDAMFQSAAAAHGPRVIGIVLTGNLDDGTAGLMAVKNGGGTAIVQDPREAPFPSMPASAVRHAGVDYVLPVGRIGPALRNLVESLRRADDTREAGAGAERWRGFGPAFGPRTTGKE